MPAELPQPVPTPPVRRRLRPIADPPDTGSWFAGKVFTVDWTSGRIGSWFSALEHLRDQPARVLEIGSYEGRSAVVLLSYLPLCHLTCIDTFHFRDDVEGRFDRNLAPFSDRLTRLKGDAAGLLSRLHRNGATFDVILLDACKDRDGVFALSALAWPLLRMGGIIIWSGLGWGADKPSGHRPGDAIRLFRDAFADCLTVLHEGGQLIARRTGVWPGVEDADAPLGYWERRRDFAYLREVAALTGEIAPNPRRVIDVGSNDCPYLDWFETAERKVSIDLRNPYRALGVESVKADFLTYDAEERFDLCLCLQVLEHVPDAAAFARKLLGVARHLVISVPYLWPHGLCRSHIHDPVDEQKMRAWFGREPDRAIIATEEGSGAKTRRLICYYRSGD